MTDKLLRERLRVGVCGLKVDAVVVTEFVVYPTARPSERMTIPVMELADRVAVERAVTGILDTRDEPRIGPALAG